VLGVHETRTAAWSDCAKLDSASEIVIYKIVNLWGCAMSAYSIADAKADLPRLINRAIAGEAVVITRHGKPVAEIRPCVSAPPVSRSEFLAGMASRRSVLRGGPITSVELLNLIYDDPAA